MNFARIQDEIRQQMRNPLNEAALPNWINDTITELAADYELPGLKLHEPATLATTTSNWLYNLSSATHTSSYVFQKKVFRVTSAIFQQGFILEPDLTAFDDIDMTHAQTGDDVVRVAIEAEQIAIYPKANDTLSLWFYRKPVAMVADTDEPDGIPEPYHYRVLVPAVILRSFRLYPDDIATALPGDNTRALTRWQAMYNAGLYGDGTSPGMIRYLTKAQRQATPRVRGAALGAQLSGGSWWRGW